ncbi:hypothetical protein M422DRAFT_53161 [Sphaerobolus stellatus SS14]|uniref:Uncharacterized protein n=1 Tax=Sphaerobolus stellatus (strain SS14) TaxID=990650 RepID=A0A0C9V3C4_SPHS4|nr:hypothetical protein M422DRAFT_53161 [Sphaerobolus stellatus SS14]
MTSLPQAPIFSWLAVADCVAVSAFETIQHWDLPVLEHLVCKTGYEADPRLIPTLKSLGRHHLSLRERFVADEPRDLEQYCPALTSIEVSTDRSGLVLASHPSILMITFEELHRCKLLSWHGMPHFSLQIELILRDRLRGKGLRYFCDTSWHQALLNNELSR